MNPRKLLYLTGIIILVVAMADMALTNQAADWTMNPRPAPRPVAVPAPLQAAPQTTPAPQQAPAAKTFIVPEPVPTPEMVTDTAVRHSTNSVTGFILPAALLLLSLGALAAWGKWHWRRLKNSWRQSASSGRERPFCCACFCSDARLLKLIRCPQMNIWIMRSTG